MWCVGMCTLARWRGWNASVSVRAKSNVESTGWPEIKVTQKVDTYLGRSLSKGISEHDSRGTVTSPHRDGI